MDKLDQYLTDNLGQELTAATKETILSLVPRLATSESIAISLPEPARFPQNTDARMVTDQSRRFVEWVARQVGSVPWDHAYGMGLVDADGEILCGVVLEDYNQVNACIHVAGIGKYWLSRTFLYAVFDYAFNQLKLKRLTGLVAQGNDAALRFDLHLGFRVECVLTDAHPDGDIYLLVMRRSDCRFLPGVRNG